MKVALINSRQDKAGVNIKNHLRNLLNHEERMQRTQGRTYEFFDIEGRLIHADGVDAEIDADLVIFLSRHSSANPVPVLTVHVTGNFGAARLGGAPRTLAPAAPAMMQAILRALAKHCPDGYRVSYEVTHHGPTGLSHPSFFVEIGSSEKEWTDTRAGRAVAESVLDAVVGNPIPLIGFGGTHYPVRETEIALISRGAFGHIAHTREIMGLDVAMILQMKEKTGAVAAYIDRKALSREEMAHLTRLLDSECIPKLSETEITALGPISWDEYHAVRQMAEQVSGGARCFIHDLKGEGALVAVKVNPVLVSEAVKADEPGLIRELDKLPVVHLSTHDNRLLPVFITYEEHMSQIINALNTLCVKIIRIKEITATESDHLIIRRVRFDPHKARELEVPAGPSYKKLAAGQAVEINGRVITPDMVASESEIKIHIPGLKNFP